MYKLEARFIAIGVVVWLAFLVFIRWVGTTAFVVGNPLLPLMFVLAIPLILVTIYLLSAITRVPIKEMPMPVFVMTFTALLLDGLAVGFTGLYGQTAEQIQAGAAFLLWGAGWGLVCSLWLAMRAQSREPQP